MTLPLQEERARQVAARYANEGDANWNRIALFIRDGVVERGLALALREVHDYEANAKGNAAADELRELRETIKYIERVEESG